MFCPNCGMKLDKGVTICPGCHQPIGADSGFCNEQNYWNQDLDNPDSWERQGIADGDFFGGGSESGRGLGGEYSDDGFRNDNDPGDGFGSSNDVGGGFSTGNDAGDIFGGENNSATGGKGRPKLLILGIIAGVLCLAVALVILVATGVIPIGPGSDSSVSQDGPKSTVTPESTYAEPESNSQVEEVRPNAVTVSHKYDLSNISVSVTGIQPPAITEKSVATSAISKVSADSGLGENSADLLIDNDRKTFWASDPDSKNPVITLDFGVEKQIGIIEMCIGAWSSETDFQKYGMPQLIEMEIDGYVYPLAFSDTMTEQYIVFSESVKASELSFRVKKTTGDGCAISEIKTYN